MTFPVALFKNIKWFYMVEGNRSPNICCLALIANIIYKGLCLITFSVSIHGSSFIWIFCKTELKVKVFVFGLLLICLIKIITLWNHCLPCLIMKHPLWCKQDDADDNEIQKMEEARQAYVAALAAAKEKQDEESLAAAASARLYLQSFLFRSESLEESNISIS